MIVDRLGNPIEVDDLVYWTSTNLKCTIRAIDGKGIKIEILLPAVSDEANPIVQLGDFLRVYNPDDNPTVKRMVEIAQKRLQRKEQHNGLQPVGQDRERANQG